MRYKNTLFSAVLATAVVGLTMVNTASASTAVQWVDESANKVCSAIEQPHTSGGCPFHAEGTIKFQGWAFVWFDEATCILEMEFRISGTGVIALDDVDLYDIDANCDGTGGEAPVVACDYPWEGTGEKATTTEIDIQSDACLNMTEVDVCTGPIGFNFVESGSANAEKYQMVFDKTDFGPLCRIDGVLLVENSGTDSPIHHN